MVGSGVVISVLGDGLELKQVEKDKRIFLSRDAWQNLSECRNQIEEALKDHEDFRWTLDDKKDIRVHVNTFNNKTYLHIRTWWNERPKKMGVALLPEDWPVLAAHLTMPLHLAVVHE